MNDKKLKVNVQIDVQCLQHIKWHFLLKELITSQLRLFWYSTFRKLIQIFVCSNSYYWTNFCTKINYYFIWKIYCSFKRILKFTHKISTPTYIQSIIGNYSIWFKLFLYSTEVFKDVLRSLITTKWI